MPVFLLSLLLVAACGPVIEAPPAEDGTVSEYRANFERSMLAACTRELREVGVPQEEIDFACPCMAQEVLENAPTDAELIANTDALRRDAVMTCVAQAEERFPRPGA